MMDKLASVLLLAMGIFVAFVLGYWWQDKTPPTEVKRIHVVNPAVKPGEFLSIQYTIYRDRNDCRVHIDRYIFDGADNRLELPDADFAVNPGPVGPDSFTERVFIPHHAVSGDARFRSDRVYWCNPVQEWLHRPVVVRQEDVEFRIVER